MFLLLFALIAALFLVPFTPTLSEFGKTFLVAGNLWFPIAIHFAWNFLLGPVLGLTVSGSGHLGLGWKMVVVDGPALFTGGAFGLEGGLVVTMTTAACIVAMIFYRRYQMRNARVFASVA